MVNRVLFLFLALTIQLRGDISDWFQSLTPRAKKAKEALIEMEAEIEKALADYQVPGIAVGLVVDGELVYSKGFGYRDIENKLPVTPNTLFPIGSCTKAFTAFLTGMFVDEGSIGWDTTAIEVFPNLRLWDFETTYQLTFRDMLTHRSGLPRHELLWYNSKLDRNELLKKLRYLDPVCHLRQRYIYGNLTYLTAGLALEKIAGESWEELVKEKILKPLEMKSTNFTLADLKKNGDHAIPYMEKNGKLQKMDYCDLSIIAPAAAMNSNVVDLSHWLQMVMAGGIYKERSLIQPSNLQEMLLPQVIASVTPEAQDITFSSYGIGWSTISYRGYYLASHDGISNGFTSVVAFLPKENIGMIVLSNKNMTAFSRFLSMEAMDKILGLPHVGWMKSGLEGLKKTKETEQDEKDNLSRKKGTTPSHSLEEFAGQYEHPAYGTVTVSVIDQRLQIAYNDVPFILDHWHYNIFSVSEEPHPLIISLEGTKFTFQTNVQGEITELHAPFEPSVKDIVFKRKPAEVHSTLSYLRKFTGIYEIYGYTVEIVIRKGVLSAIIPGQPVFELVPLGENEFNVKSRTGYNVRFILDSMGQVKEVLLMQPYGTFSAKPKKS